MGTRSKMLSLHGLKWNPFSPDVPQEALWVHERLDLFCWRVERQLPEGGFALVTGDPGTGKSVALRVVSGRVGAVRDTLVGVMSHPAGGLSDFYRELGELFGVGLAPRNRWGSFKALRDKWRAHVESARMRPVLLFDEAQEAPDPVLTELRILASDHFDSRSLLTAVLCGDARLPAKLRTDALLPLASRVRARLDLEYLPPDQLMAFLQHALSAAGAPDLVSEALAKTLCEHAAGNLRTLCSMGAELLAAAERRELKVLDEKLFFEVLAPKDRPSAHKARAR